MSCVPNLLAPGSVVFIAHQHSANTIFLYHLCLFGCHDMVLTIIVWHMNICEDGHGPIPVGWGLSAAQFCTVATYVLTPTEWRLDTVVRAQW